MIIAHSIRELEAWRKRAVGSESCRSTTIGFVPTMGALHSGHIALVNEARAHCDQVVVSIFVNPTQFNDPKDCETYPTPIEADLALCEEAGVDAVFLPTKAMLYPDDYRFKMTESIESSILEGAFRPGHFDGVLTVVLKLFLLVRPSHAWFGEKDWQQLRLIEDMVEAYFLPIKILRGKTIREADGLAMSSRNRRLSEEGRKKAPAFARILREAETAEDARHDLLKAGFEVEYVEDHDNRRLGAVLCEGVRLIDNLPLAPKGVLAQ